MKSLALLFMTVFVPLLLSTLVGCALFHPPVNPNNFRTRARIQEDGMLFYSARQRSPDADANGRYDDPKTGRIFYRGHSDCVPPFVNILCRYVLGEAVNVKSLSVYLNDHRNLIKDNTEALDLTHLVGAEVAIQKGYSKFIIHGYRINNYCGSSESIQTTGRISGNQYTGSSYVATNSSCSSSLRAKILLFNDYSLISKGLFVTRETQPVVPYEPIYTKRPRESGLWPTRPAEAWKIYFDARESADKLLTVFDLSAMNDYLIEAPKPSSVPVIDSLKRSGE